jgi:hypothetical protein
MKRRIFITTAKSAFAATAFTSSFLAADDSKVGTINAAEWEVRER